MLLRGQLVELSPDGVDVIHATHVCDGDVESRGRHSIHDDLL
jgi:hypothetical protein